MSFYDHQFGSEDSDAGTSNMTSKHPFPFYRQSNAPRTYEQTTRMLNTDDDGSITFSLSSWANMDLTSPMAEPSDRLYNSDGAFQYTENGIVLIKNMPKLHVNSSKNAAYYKYHDENSSCAGVSLSSWAVLSLSSGAYNNSNGDPSSSTPPPHASVKNKILPLNHARTKTAAAAATAAATNSLATNKRSSCNGNSNKHSGRRASRGKRSASHRTATNQKSASPSLLPIEAPVQDKTTAVMNRHEGATEEKRLSGKYRAAAAATAATHTPTSNNPTPILMPTKGQKQLVPATTANHHSSKQIMVPHVKTTTRRTILPSNPTRRLLAIRPLSARK